MELLWGSTDMIQIKYLEQILAQNKYSQLEVLQNSFAQLQNQKYGEGKTISNIIFIKALIPLGQ